MGSQASILLRCCEDAAAASARALQRCIDQAVTNFQAEEAAAGAGTLRDRIALAWNSLLRLRSTLPEAYATALRSAFRAVSGGAKLDETPTPSSFASLGSGLSGFASLTLVDDAQITENIEFARLSQRLRGEVETQMADLDALVCAALGLESVQPDSNPLRPEVFAGALREVLDHTAADPETRARWMKAFAGPLGRELTITYASTLAVLSEANVQAVSYRWVGKPGSGQMRREFSDVPSPIADLARSAGPGGWGAGPGPTNSDGATEGGPAPLAPIDPMAKVLPAMAGGWTPLEVSANLYEDFLVHGVEHEERLSETYYTRIEQELAQLRAKIKAMPVGLAPPADPDRPIDGHSALSPQAWGAYSQSANRRLVGVQLQKEATHVGQVLGLEVVRQLVNQVAQDPRLLVPVREAIVALEPSLLRLAMVDPRFFSDETHPGRRLMERVAQRSFKYEDADNTEFQAFFELVRKTFNNLNALKIDSAQPFNSALGTLEQDWNLRDGEEEARQQELLQSLRFAEERQALADQIAYDMSSRPDLDKVPAPVLDFLYGPWALAMAHARLVDQDRQIDPRGFGLVVSDLVWSVKRDFTLRQPAKLMDMIPGMLRKINSGLDLIGLDRGSREAFMDVLMRLHGPVLRLRRLKSERDAQESGAMPLEPDLAPASPEQRVPKAAAQPWLAPTQLAEAGFGFEDAAPSGPAELEEGGDADPSSVDEPAASGSVPLDSGPGDGPETREELIDAVLDGLTTGCWVDLHSHKRWLRAQLIWASTRGTLFMFVSRGGRAHSMTRRSCARLVERQRLRPVGAHGVVAHALEVLKEEAKAKAAAQGER